ncbi:MAG: ferritin family protein [Candidatus Zixiibacteriota bacterium]
MNVFEFAMKMEKDGQNFYESEAAKSKNPALKKIWQQLAGDEIKHYEIFKRFRDGDVNEAKAMAELGTQILNTAKTIFEQLPKSGTDFNFGDDVIAAWNKAQHLENETEKFYREKAVEEKLPDVKSAFKLLADEEHKHVVLIEHVLAFLHEPKSWLDDAEWSNISY